MAASSLPTQHLFFPEQYDVNLETETFNGTQNEREAAMEKKLRVSAHVSKAMSMAWPPEELGHNRSSCSWLLALPGH